jgi:hypothetical protein
MSLEEVSVEDFNCPAAGGCQKPFTIRHCTNGHYSDCPHYTESSNRWNETPPPVSYW